MSSNNEPIFNSKSNVGVMLTPRTGLPVLIAIASAYALSAVLATLITTPGSVVESLFTASVVVPRDRILPLASLFYAFIAYGLTPACSVVGVAMGNEYGYDNKAPRLAKLSLSGLPHRMVASHQNLLEIFPLYALAAGLTATLDVSPSVYRQNLNLLLLHVFCKTVIYIPAYLFNQDLIRSSAHFVGIGALLGNLWLLTFA